MNFPDTVPISVVDLQSGRMIITFEISAPRIVDGGVEIDAPALGEEDGAAVQVASGAHVAATIQQHVWLPADGFAQFKIIVHGLLGKSP